MREREFSSQKNLLQQGVEEQTKKKEEGGEF